MKRMFSILCVLMGLIAWSSLADAACTYGTNCYCDKVVPVAGAYYDANLLLCEDWEAPTLHDNTGSGVTTASTRGSGGTSAYGPWYDDTGNATARGNNSYMVKKYSGCGAGCWTSGLPASPTVGTTCGFGTCYQAEYRSDNLWQGNTIGTGSGACIDVIKTGSSNANDEDAALGIPDTFGSTDSRGVWDGNQSFGYRVATNSAENENKTCGIVGTALYGRTVHTIGLTMAMAYGDNTASIGILAAPLKHEEFGVTGDTNYQEFWASGNTGLNAGAGAGGFPFGAFRFSSSQSACNTALAAATVSVGQADCTSTALRIGTTSGVYQQSTNWPMGKWGCVRAYMSGMNTTSMTYWIKFHDGTTETTVFSMTGFDAQNGLHNQGYNYNVWNTYSNASSPSVGTGGTTGPYRRWIDNYHVTEGTPVTCAQIGFTGSGSVPGTRFSPGTTFSGSVRLIDFKETDPVEVTY